MGQDVPTLGALCCLKLFIQSQQPCVVDTIQLRTLHTERLKDLPKVTDEAGVTQVPRT